MFSCKEIFSKVFLNIFGRKIYFRKSFLVVTFPRKTFRWKNNVDKFLLVQKYWMEISFGRNYLIKEYFVGRKLFSSRIFFFVKMWSPGITLVLIFRSKNQWSTIFLVDKIYFGETFFGRKKFSFEFLFFADDLFCKDYL